jgi:hypothetical protein
MSLQRKYLKILSEIAPAGLVGASMLLASTASSTAKEEPEALQPSASLPVSERLAAIRGAVSSLAEQNPTAQPDDAAMKLAWGNWWRNWGWYRPWRGWGWPNWPNWPNWRNWNNWWHNW